MCSTSPGLADGGTEEPPIHLARFASPQTLDRGSMQILRVACIFFGRPRNHVQGRWGGRRPKMTEGCYDEVHILRDERVGIEPGVRLFRVDNPHTLRASLLEMDDGRSEGSVSGDVARANHESAQAGPHREEFRLLLLDEHHGPCANALARDLFVKPDTPAIRYRGLAA
jgi:hypothetical protein